MRPHERGFRLDGVHSWFDKGFIIPTDPQVYYPSKIKTKERLIGTNTILDVSTAVSGIQPFEERRIKITINILDYGVIKSKNTQQKAMDLMNWLYLPTGKRRLELDIIPHFYFMGELEEGNDFETNLMEYGIAEVYFTCYPFRRSSLSKGDDFFRSFDFRQGTRFSRKPIVTTTRNDYPIPLKKHEVGDVVTLAPWSQRITEDSSVGNTTRFHLYQPKVIKSISTTTTTNPNIIDKTRYTFESGESVWAQDILESFPDIIDKSPEVTLINDGSVRVKPNLNLYSSPPTVFYLGIYVECNGVRHLWRRVFGSPDNKAYNDTMFLEPGENKLKFIGIETQVRIWIREEYL